MPEMYFSMGIRVSGLCQLKDVSLNLYRPSIPETKCQLIHFKKIFLLFFENLLHFEK